MKDALTSFANRVKIPSSERDDLSLLAQKYVALHMPVPIQRVCYNAIASDFDMRSLRSNGQTEECTKQGVEPAVFVELMRKGYGNLNHAGETVLMQRFPDFARFKNSVIAPIDPKKEGWRQAGRTDCWKDVACFLASGYVGNAKLRTILPAIVPDGIDPVQMKRSMESFHAKHGGMEIGSLLRELCIPDDIFIADEETKREAPAAPHVESVAPFRIVTERSAASSSKEIDMDRINGFRIRAQISPLCPPEKVVKQMLLAAVGVRVPADPGVLDDYQREIPPLCEGEAAVAAEQLDALSPKPFDANASVRCRQVAMRARRERWDLVSLLKEAVTAECKDADTALESYIQLL